MTPPSVPPPHAPEFGPMRRWLGSLHVTGVLWYRLHRWGVKVLPTWAMAFFITLFTASFFLLLPRIRRAIAANLEAVLGPCGWWQRQRRAYRTLHNFAWCLSERYERLGTGVQSEEQVEGEDLWRETLASGEGLILVTAHIGHWEVGAMQVQKRHVHIVREEEMDPSAQAFVRELFAEQGDSGFTMHFVRDDPSFGMRLVSFLRRGDIIAVQGDRPRSVGRFCGVEIFERPLSLPVGPAALARAAGVVMLPVFVFRRGRRRSRVVFRPPVRVEKPGRRGLAEAMGEIAGHVEWAIRQEPFQWFCFRELWPKTPALLDTGDGPRSASHPSPVSSAFLDDGSGR